jgi:hypothetical protein
VIKPLSPCFRQASERKFKKLPIFPCDASI